MTDWEGEFDDAGDLSEADLRRFGSLLTGLQPVAPPLQLLQCVVHSVQTGSVTLYLGGDITTPVPGIRYFVDCYSTPTAGDVVWVFRQGADYMVLGQLA